MNADVWSDVSNRESIRKTFVAFGVKYLLEGTANGCFTAHQYAAGVLTVEGKTLRVFRDLLKAKSGR